MSSISALLTLGLGLTACKTVTTQKQTASRFEGIPYSLPMTSVAIEIGEKDGAANDDRELTLTTTASLVPNPNERYLLTSVENALFESEHEVKLNNGLLSLVQTDDKSRIEEVVTNLTTTALNVVKIAAFSPSVGQESGEKDELDPRWYAPEPTEDEIRAAFESISALPIRYHFFAGETIDEVLPGTGGLLSVRAELQSLPGAETEIKSGEMSDNERAYPGVLVKTLAPSRVILTVVMDAGKLHARRQQALAGLPGDKARGALLTAVKNYESESPKSFVIVKETTLVMAPDYAPTTRIRMARDAFGDTINKLTLVDGVLTQYELTDPSEFAEASKIPVEVTSSLLNLPTELLQLKLNYSNEAGQLLEKEKELMEAQLELMKAQAALDAARSGSGTDGTPNPPEDTQNPPSSVSNP